MIFALTLLSCDPTVTGETDMLKLEQLIEAGNVAAMSNAITTQEISIESLTRAYLNRIDSYDGRLGAVISINPGVLAEARSKDEQIQNGVAKIPPLFGIPVLVKDNIETRELATTAGSLFLKDNQMGRDADIITALRNSGAIILGKANLTEWANFRARLASSGWSAVGGQTRNPYDTNRSPCGSSAGSAVAVAARLAPVAIGTETNGSVICPSSINGVVGIKPTIGLLSQSGIVPISHSKDTAGPIAVDVESAALLLVALAGNKMALPELEKTDLAGRRFGVVRSAAGYHDQVDERFEESIATLKAAGATIIDDLSLKPEQRSFYNDEFQVLLTEFKHDLNAYLDTIAGNLSLKKLIEFNKQHADEEMPHFPQDILIQSESTSGIEDPEYVEALQRIQKESREGIDRLLAKHNLDALVAPSGGAAWTIDHVNGDHSLGGFSSFPAISGYPHITLPMGLIRGLPVGISLVTSHGKDSQLISLAMAVETTLEIQVRPDLEQTR